MGKSIDYIERIQIIREWEKKYCKDFNPKKSYPQTKTSKTLTAVGHRTAVGKAFRIAEVMETEKASKKEMERIIRYLMVCIDAGKYHLNYRKAYEDFGVFELARKYKTGMY